MELIETIAKVTDRGAEVAVHLTTKTDTTPDHARKQVENLETIRDNAAVAGKTPSTTAPSPPIPGG